MAKTPQKKKLSSKQLKKAKGGTASMQQVSQLQQTEANVLKGMQAGDATIFKN